MKVTYIPNSLLHKLTLFSLILVSQYACADIYLDASATDEIRLSNNPTDVTCCVLIVEPAANLTDVTSASNDLNSLTIDAKKINQLPFNREVAAAAKETLLDPALIHAVIATESHHNPKALSPRGAQGLMQLMPFTARRFSVRDAFNPAQNILAGARYLRELKDLYNGDMLLALAAYNAGPEAVNRYGRKIPPFKETMGYVPRVLNIYKNLTKI
jgi:soluble lytic murein transglycosylase-like protein